VLLLQERSERLLFSLAELGCCLLEPLSDFSSSEYISEQTQKSSKPIFENMSSSLGTRPQFKESPKLKLKPPPQRLPPHDPGRKSDELHPSVVPSKSEPRACYLNHLYSKGGVTSDQAAVVPPPLISASPFVPMALVRFLMRGKKDSALGVKYIPGDKITDSKYI
jgi:hypothetical protein